MDVPTIYKGYVRGYPPKIWPYMVQYLHFRILEFPLIDIFTHMPMCYVFVFLGRVSKITMKQMTLGCSDAIPWKMKVEPTQTRILPSITGWWFQTFVIFHNMWDNSSHWLIFFKMVKTTNQIIYFWICSSMGPSSGHPQNVRLIFAPGNTVEGRPEIWSTWHPMTWELPSGKPT